jgi:hypothetical protein
MHPMTPEVESITSLSAQNITGKTVDDDGELLFWIEDGEAAVEVSHEIGDPEVAARRLTDLGQAMILHAERIRGRNRVEVSWT